MTVPPCIPALPNGDIFRDVKLSRLLFPSAPDIRHMLRAASTQEVHLRLVGNPDMNLVLDYLLDGRFRLRDTDDLARFQKQRRVWALHVRSMLPLVLWETQYSPPVDIHVIAFLEESAWVYGEGHADARFRALFVRQAAARLPDEIPEGTWQDFFAAYDDTGFREGIAKALARAEEKRVQAEQRILDRRRRVQELARGLPAREGGQEGAEPSHGPRTDEDPPAEAT